MSWDLWTVRNPQIFSDRSLPCLVTLLLYRHLCRVLLEGFNIRIAYVLEGQSLIKDLLFSSFAFWEDSSPSLPFEVSFLIEYPSFI